MIVSSSSWDFRTNLAYWNYNAGLQICERSLTSSTGGPTGPPSTTFIRAEMLPSGYLIRPCEGGGSIIHIVDHIDLDVSKPSMSQITL